MTTINQPKTPAWKPIVGQSFQPADFANYCESLQWTNWRPSFIVLHNTAIPTLASRPDGLTLAHINGLVKFYRDEQHWSAGPHLFVDDRQIWVFTPLTTPGVHSPSWNRLALGVEMLGDYQTEAFDNGRGLDVKNNAVAALAILSATLGFTPESLHLHKEDRLTDHKGCPGMHVNKDHMIAAVAAAMTAAHGGEHLTQA